MQVQDIMVRHIHVLTPDTPLRDASAQIKALGVDPLPVLDGENVVGMVTEDDLIRAASSVGPAGGALPVRNAMRDPVSVSAGDSIEQARTVLQANESLPGLIVLDPAGRISGVVSAHDLRAGVQVLPPVTGADGASQPKVDFVGDPVDFESQSSFPASDPPPRG